MNHPQGSTGAFTRLCRTLAGCGLPAVLSLALLAAPWAARADYPEKPLTLIVPWAAGGGTDSVARAIASALEKELGVIVNVVNRTGGSGVVGHSAMATAKPDGYTIGLITGELTMMHWQGLTKLTYKDFTPLGMINYDYAGIQVASNAKYQDVKSLIQDIAQQPKGTLKASGTGQGGIWHIALAGLLLDQQIAPDQVTWIPSQGAAPAMVELVSGGIDIVPSSIAEGRSMLDAKRSKALAVMAPERNPSYPDVPTLKEGLGTGYTIGVWRGIAGPKGLDEQIAAKLESAIQAAFQSDTYKGFMSKQGFGAEWRGRQDFEKFLAENDAMMGDLIEKVGLKR
ncbi:tripartite tricarboxylate transporter substrate binding protein [Orrella sp. JC864]|uniref:tripartite tricarboxylate transporter substrate binding protein n=1 Tax=Orrella sp. JC864 TaxID=3120298 RepID=UPI00300AF6C4